MSSLPHFPIPRNAFSSGLGERMRQILDPHLRPGSYPRLARALGVNHETLRRMYHQGTWSTQVLMIVCEKIGVSGHWLLTGQGPRMAAEAGEWARQSASPSELLRALGERMREPEDEPAPDEPSPRLQERPVLRLATHGKT